MKRRDFLQFMGVSAASTTASVALAKLPEAQSQIILLDKSKEIIKAKTIPDVDFIISQDLINIKYSDERPIAELTRNYTENLTGVINHYNIVEVELEVWAFNGNNHLMEVNAFDTFIFDFPEDCFNYSEGQRYDNLYQLIGRKFKVIKHTVNMSTGTPTTVSIRAEEIM